MFFTASSPFIAEICFIFGLRDARCVIDFLGHSADKENSVSIFAIQFLFLHLIFHIRHFSYIINDLPQAFSEHTVEDRFESMPLKMCQKEPSLCHIIR